MPTMTGSTPRRKRRILMVETTTGMSAMWGISAILGAMEVMIVIVLVLVLVAVVVVAEGL
jgi:hypothetical protein